jgi:hypothetical protein
MNTRFLIADVGVDLYKVEVFFPIQKLDKNCAIMDSNIAGIATNSDHLQPDLANIPPSITSSPASTKPKPHLHPEIWELIFALACTSLKALDRATRICKSVRQYCFRSPATKARFLIKRYGKDQAIVKSFLKGGLMGFADADEVLGYLLAFGAKGVCNNDQM